MLPAVQRGPRVILLGVRFTHTHSHFPKRIIIARHGESKGNLSDRAYVTTPDWLIPLSKTGLAQSKALGRRLKHLIKEEPIYFYTSPYLRTRQTLANVLEGLSEEQVVGVREEPRLTEQQFGNFQDVSEVRRSKIMRGKYGRFYFRFPMGESGLDVYNRASSFINTLQRDFEDREVVPDHHDSNMLLMTHGLTMRLLMMRFFEYTVTDFENSENSRNCGIVIMERKEEYYEPLPYQSPKLTQIYTINDESRKLIHFPKEGKLDTTDLIKQMKRPGLGSMVDPGEHMAYWSTGQSGKKKDFK